MSQLTLPLIDAPATHYRMEFRRDDETMRVREDHSEPTLVHTRRRLIERWHAIGALCEALHQPSMFKHNVSWELAPRGQNWYGLEPDSGGAHVWVASIVPVQEQSHDPR